MKKQLSVGLKGLTLIGVLVFSSTAWGQQNVGNMLQTADTELGNAFGTFKSVLNWISLFLLGGGILLAGYAYMYDQSKMKVATIAIIAAVLLFAIGYGMGVIG